MGNALKRICTILARGGSKGLPGKNRRQIAGKPLIAHAIEQARAADLFDAIAVSSDDEKLLATAEDWGIEHIVRRPPEMANDTASKLPAIRHCAVTVEQALGIAFDVIVDIDVTSPLRTAEDIRGAVSLQEQNDVSCVITGARSRKSPYFNQVECDSEGFARLVKPLEGRLDRRQDAPVTYDMNAAVYVWRYRDFMENPTIFYPDTLLYEMPDDRSHDIDTPLDFDFVELLMTRRAET
jgi:CMP-N,N'-diacetyllegionaminic acid synthase